MTQVPVPDLRSVRVVFILYYYSPYSSGLTLYIQNLAEDLARRGARVTVIAGRHDSSSPRREFVDGVTVHRVRPVARITKGMVLPTFIPAAIRASRIADVVIPVMPLLEAGPISRCVRRFALLPVYVCDLRLDDSFVGRLVERLAAFSARSTIRRATRHVALSEDYASSSRVLRSFTGRTVGVRPPVDAERFTARDPGPLRDRLGLGARPVVGFVGRLVAEKGIPHLIRAMQRVREQYPDTALVIAGEGEAVAGGGLGDELRRLVAGDPNVSFTGFLAHEDLLAFYSMCAVLALPSVDPLEAFGMVQVEAMLCGCPVVASDMPGVREPVTSTGMGRLVAPGDEPALAAALAEVLGDRERFVVSRTDVLRQLDPRESYDRFARLVAEVSRRAVRTE